MAFCARTFSSTNTSAATVCGGFCSSPLSQTFTPASQGLITNLNLCSVDFYGLSDSSINGALRAHSLYPTGAADDRTPGTHATTSLLCPLLNMKFSMCLYCYTKQNKNEKDFSKSLREFRRQGGHFIDISTDAPGMVSKRTVKLKPQNVKTKNVCIEFKLKKKFPESAAVRF